MANETAPTWMRPYRNVASQTGSILGKYLADRGPHLAAMVAYYALLSLFPFIFLALSAIGLLGHVSQSSYLIREMGRILPSESVADLVRLTRSVQSNAGTFFVIGLVGMLWSALGFYSALESALNIVFRVGNRGFVAGKWISFVLTELAWPGMTRLRKMGAFTDMLSLALWPAASVSPLGAIRCHPFNPRHPRSRRSGSSPAKQNGAHRIVRPVSVSSRRDYLCAAPAFWKSLRYSP